MAEENETTEETTDGAETAAPEEAAQQAPAPAVPAEALTPKERRRRARVAKAAKVPTRAATTPEERQAERDSERRRKAQMRRTERTRTRTKAQAAGKAPAAAATTAPREHHRGTQKTRQGIVVSDKADKTIIVRIDVARRHRRYEKIVRTSTTLHAHDERNDANVGDKVVVRESRPLSRTKRWRLIEVLERAK